MRNGCAVSHERAGRAAGCGWHQRRGNGGAGGIHRSGKGGNGCAVSHERAGRAAGCGWHQRWRNGGAGGIHRSGKGGNSYAVSHERAGRAAGCGWHQRRGNGGAGGIHRSGKGGNGCAVSHERAGRAAGCGWRQRRGDGGAGDTEAIELMATPPDTVLIPTALPPAPSPSAALRIDDRREGDGWDGAVGCSTQPIPTTLPPAPPGGRGADQTSPAGRMGCLGTPQSSAQRSPFGPLPLRGRVGVGAVGTSTFSHPSTQHRPHSLPPTTIASPQG